MKSKIKYILSNFIKFILDFNLATVIRLFHIGIAFINDWIQQRKYTIDPFLIKEKESGLHNTYDPIWDSSIIYPRQTVGVLSYNKLCNVEDFRHPDLVPWLREIYSHEISRFGAKYPLDFEDRRQWEIAMTIRTFNDHGILNDQSQILGVGAGNEPTIFYLTKRVKRVFSTDLYFPLEKNWAEADVSMLRDPGANWPFPWNPKRLVTQHMDGRSLMYENESFDGVFSSGSIEHFGSLNQIQQSVSEIYRVLKPGGIMAIATEFKIDGPGIGLPGTVLFTPELIQERIIGKLSWKALSPFDYELSETTRKTELLQTVAMKAFRNHVRKHKRLLYHKYIQAKYPIILMRDDPFKWTSVTIALRKEA